MSSEPSIEPREVLDRWKDWGTRPVTGAQHAAFREVYDALAAALRRTADLEAQLASLRAENEALGLVKEVMGWMVEHEAAHVHGYLQGHHALDPIHDLPTFYRMFPAADLTGWMKRNAESLAATEAALAQEKP